MTIITLEDKLAVVVIRDNGDPGVLIPPDSCLTPRDLGHILAAMADRLILEEQ